MESGKNASTGILKMSLSLACPLHFVSDKIHQTTLTILYNIIPNVFALSHVALCLAHCSLCRLYL